MRPREKLLTMSTIKTIFACQKCGAQTAKWAGRCVECGTWGSLTEEIKDLRLKIKESQVRPGKVVTLGDIKTTTSTYHATGIDEVDRVLGGGITKGGVYLLAGEPGIGKSTLVAQIAAHIRHPERSEGTHTHAGRLAYARGSSATPQNDGVVLYVSAEESPEQLKNRFTRMGISGDHIAVLTDTTAETVAATIEHLKPALAIIDSIQMMTADAAEDAGAPTKLRASTALLAETAKRTGIPLLLIGQVTKALDIAGPKSLEHIVDAVLLFEGDRDGRYRLLRATKNRFGSTDEIGVFEMTSQGLREVKNPSSAFLETRSHAPGSIVTCVLEGSRPILIEIQALASKTHFPYPERRASGFDVNRLNMLLAVLEKNSNIKVSGVDIHINITSGLKIREPAADLAVLLAIVSSITGKSLPTDLAAFGEVGLGGELRPVRDPARRINEAKKLGFTSCISPQSHKTLHEILTFLKLV